MQSNLLTDFAIKIQKIFMVQQNHNQLRDDQQAENELQQSKHLVQKRKKSLVGSPFTQMDEFLYFPDVWSWNIQLFNIKPKMAQIYNQDIYDVLDLGYPSTWNNNNYTRQDQQIDFEEYYENLKDAKEKIQELAPTNQTQDSLEDQPNQDEQLLSEKNDQVTGNTTPETFQQITYEEIEFSQEKINERNQVIKGYNYETQNMGKLLKFTTSSFLNILIKTKDLDTQEEEVAKEFSSSNGSLQNYKKLFQWEGISQRCREYFESKTFIQNIMISNKMDLRSKVKMLRHLQKFRKMTFKEAQKWKMSTE